MGIGSAPEFLRKFNVEKIFKKNEKRNEKRIYNLLKTWGIMIYPITYQLIKDGRKNKVLNKKINYKINITMVHGQKDEVCSSFSYSKKVLKIFKNSKKEISNCKKW